MSNNVCLLQKRKVETVPLATQVSPATPVPSLPSSAEASQASVFPAVRETNTFKSREDHEQLSTLTTVKTFHLCLSVFELKSLSVGLCIFSSFFCNDRTALLGDSSPRSQGGKEKQTVGEQMRYVTSLYPMFTVSLLFSHFKCVSYPILILDA